MKRFLCFCFSAAAGLILAGCPGSTVTTSPDPTLDITYNGTVDNNLTIGNIPVEGGEFVISVKSNRDWKFIEVEDDIFLGLSVSPKSGTKNETVSVTITVPANVVGDLPIPDDDGNAREKTLEFRTTPEGDEEPLIRTVRLSQLAGNGDGPQPDMTLLKAARFDNYQNAYGTDRGLYLLMFQYDNEAGFTQEVRFELVSEYNPDILMMDLANGTYEYSTSHDKGTMTDNASIILDPSRIAGPEIKVTGGSVTIGDGIVTMNLDLEDDEKFTAKYEGSIYPHLYPDVTADTTGLDSWDDVRINEFKGYSNMWEIVMRNTANNTSLRLVVNTQAGLSALPTGIFPMASTPLEGVAGTAEPASMLGIGNIEDHDWGCWYMCDYDGWKWSDYYGFYAQYAVRG